MTYNRALALRILSDHGLLNVSLIFDVAEVVGLYLPAACAQMEKESGGDNVYGHDVGGTMSGFPFAVYHGNWQVFWWYVNEKGHQSNGVGPAQITWPGFFREMIAAGLRPWNPVDNMHEGFRVLKGYHDAVLTAGSKQPWVDAGTRYNGDHDYGLDLAAKTHLWADRLRLAKGSP